MTQTPSRRDILGRALAIAGSAILGGEAADASAVVPRTGSSRSVVLAEQPVVQTNSGPIRGFATNGINVFLGVPYGASTAGENRFLPPRRPEPWSNVLDTLNYGLSCPYAPAGRQTPELNKSPQDAFLLYRSWTPHAAGEDCLRLNLWAPAGSGKRPVMVYMHGGGLFAGSGNDLPAYDGENLARRGDAIVITNNHRLNIFGFLDLSGYGGRWADSVNLGFQDIVAVLRWVRDNIMEFGGDPDNVTIFGQSGGGMKVHALMRMPTAKGLFHRAIIQSGVFAGMGSVAPEVSHATTAEVLKELGITPATLDDLAKIPTDRLCQAAVTRRNIGAVHDGRLLIEAMTEGTAPSLSSGVPLLIGSNLNELTNPVDKFDVAEKYDDAALLHDVATRYGDSAPAIVRAYRAEYPRLRAYEVYCAIQAAAVRRPSYELAARKYAQDGKAWQYMFRWRTPVLRGTPGCFHSAEIAFAFHNAGRCVNQTGGGTDALALADHVADAWLAFARHGNPSHPGLPHWPAFHPSRPVMMFDNPCSMVANPEGSGLALIEKAGVGTGRPVSG